jgi:hypothetical protein
MGSVIRTGAGALGGGLLLLTRMFTMPAWARYSIGFGGSVGLNYFRMPSVAAGLAGATMYSLGENTFGTMLHDDGMEDAEYVDPNTLSDTGYTDNSGNPIVQDPDQVMYALSDDGTLTAVGDGQGLPGVSMLPLQDAYALSNNYALSSSVY